MVANSVVVLYQLMISDVDALYRPITRNFRNRHQQATLERQQFSVPLDHLCVIRSGFARNKMAVSLSSQLMTFNAENEYDNQISRMDEVEDLSTCSVCFSEYNSDKRIAKFLPCFHTFCLECLRVNNFSILKELFF